MKIAVLKCDEPNTGKFIGSEGRIIEIKKGRYILNDTSHPLYSDKELYFKRIYCLEFKNKKIYFLNYYGNTEHPVKGIHIGLTKWQNHKFFWIQNKHWLQKEENIRYLVNVLFLILGAYIAIKNIK
ncbi:hypothetical protein [Flavobacterium sp.]|jgi:hypothetical protein|uniref:hypothetical protein n=1 Tax=Flavobacterium sp. TaxID=239 RepID=UPI0037BE8F33